MVAPNSRVSGTRREGGGADYTSGRQGEEGRYAVGVDLGGTKIEAVLFDVEQAAVLERVGAGTPASDYHRTAGTIVRLVRGVTSGLPGGVSGVDRVGVCTPGTEYGPDRLVMNSNVRSLQGRPLRRDVRRMLGRAIEVRNDADCFALAEARMGAGAGYGVVFGAVMGTGVGGGIVVDGEVYRGGTGTAGEWGHHTLHVGGNLCHCGRRGCAEAYLSGPALERRWAELTRTRLGMPQIASVLARDGKDGWKGDTDGGGGGGGGGEGMAPDGACDDKIRIWLDEALENFGYALANVIDIVDPDVVVLGGGLSNVGMWYDRGAESVRRKALSGATRNVPILRNGLGDSAGAIGACLV